MNFKSTLFFLLVSVFSYGQIVKLEKLSQGKFYSSDVIKDNNNNIKGYFLLFEADKIAKETYQLEYVVIDENLTKVTSGMITEMKYESFLIKAQAVDVDVSLYNNKLLLKFTDEFEGMSAYRRYRILDVTTNKLSDPFIFNKGEIKINPESDRKGKNYKDNESERIYFYNGIGMMVNSEYTDRKKNQTKRYIAHYDDNYKEVWKYVYGDTETNKKHMRDLAYLTSDKEVLVMFNHYANANGMHKNDFSALFINSKTGKLINEFTFPDVKGNAYRVVNTVIKDDKIYLMGNFSEESKSGFINDEENTGLFNFVFNKEKGTLEKSSFKRWEDFGENVLKVDDEGFVSKEGYLYIHEMLLLDDKIIAVTETFRQSPITTNNMYFMDLTPELNVNSVFEVSKFRNKFPKTIAHSSQIKAYGLFDFIDYQALGDNEFLFLFNDNERKSKNRNKSTLYGVVSYSGGKFNRQTINLKTDVSTIRAYNSKKGYLMLVEDFDDREKPTEFRLEKVNY